jgi:3-oxoacyl-[acyl-carrier protein] reductase
MDLGIKGKNALVTGGSRGLGRAAALSLAGEGVNVAICGRTKGDLDETVGEIEALGVSCLGVVADVSETASLSALHSLVSDGLGPIDILANNVGGSGAKADIDDTSLDDLRAVFDLNLFGGYELMRLVLPQMKERKWGRIVNIASIYGREHGGKLSYMAAKAALIATTKHAAVSLASSGVLVNSIAPGSILHAGGTWERFERDNPPEVVDNFIGDNLPMGKWGWPAPVGDLVAFLSSDRADLMTGACIVVDGGQSHSMI